MSSPTHFTIIAERCTGNHFARFALLRNFDISYSPEYSSHFFSDDLIHNTNTTSNIDNTLFISIVRHPIDWIDSFFKRLHHIPSINKFSISAFISNEFYSIFEEGQNINKEIMEDRHLLSKNRYKNIFEMRYVKYMWMLHKLPQMVKNHIIIPYEFLRDNYIETLEFIEKKFNLKRKNDEFIHVDQYKGTYNYNFIKKTIVIKPHIQEQILQSICPLLESKLGYNIPNSKLVYNISQKCFIPYKYEYFPYSSSNNYRSILDCMTTNNLPIKSLENNNNDSCENISNTIEIYMNDEMKNDIIIDNKMYKNIKVGDTGNDIELFFEKYNNISNKPCNIDEIENQKNYYSQFFINNDNPNNYSPSFNRLLPDYKLQ